MAFFGKSFKFVFYMSSASRSESIGVELCEALQEFVHKKGITNFEVVIRLSRENVNASRWESDFIRSELSRHNANDIRKVWVCGPPAMSETFEKCFDDIKKDNIGLNHQLDIL